MNLRSIMPFIKKDDDRLPDSYTITVLYLDGLKEDFEIAHHKIIEATNCLELVTKDDLWSLIPMTSIKKMMFDKNFSKIIALKQEQMLKQQQELAKK